MPTFIVTDDHLNFLQVKHAVPSSRVIDTEEAKRLKQNFYHSGGTPTGYAMDVANLSKFIDKLFKAPNGGKSKGVAIRFGRADKKPEYNVAFEAVLYERSSVDGPITWYSYLENTYYFSRLSPDFKDDYDFTNRSNVNMQLCIEDTITKPGIRMALVGMGTFLEFLDDRGEFEFLKIDFARNDKGQLTVILSRAKGEEEIVSSALGITGIYLDDNDLIPPPF